MSGKTAVVFIHGFMGCSKQFDDIAKALEGGSFDMFRHVLPGHERDAAYFISSNADQWQKSTDGFIDTLRKEYDKIVLVGHSMGGLIAARAAISNPDKICKVVAIGFPIKVTLRPIWVKNNMLASKPFRQGEDERISAARKMSGVKMSNRGDFVKSFPRSSQFLRVARMTRRELSQLKVPLTVINFTNDEIVSGGAKRFVENALPNANILMLEGSYHFLFTKDEVEIMADEIKKAAQ